MGRKLLAAVVALLVVPIAAGYANETAASGESPTTCQAVPVKTDSTDVTVGDQHVHLPGRSNPTLCVTSESKLSGTPTVTFYEKCGSTCFAARVADLEVYQDLRIEILYSEDGKQQSIDVDPAPQNVTKDMDEICLSRHPEGTQDPCTGVHLTSPSDLVGRGGRRNIALTWTPSEDAYGRSQVAGYEVWRSLTGEGDSFQQIAMTAETAFTDVGLPAKTTAWYFVVAFDADGNRSGGSQVAKATTK